MTAHIQGDTTGTYPEKEYRRERNKKENN